MSYGFFLETLKDLDNLRYLVPFDSIAREETRGYPIISNTESDIFQTGNCTLLDELLELIYETGMLLIA